jgi:hypothetical protein
MLMALDRLCYSFSGMNLTNPFAILVGEELNTVAFVMDYVEFHFNGPRVRALTNPIVHTSRGDVQFPMPGSRDALCSLIGLAVSEAALKEGNSLTFSFSSGVELIIPLDPDSYIGPEALHWHPADGIAHMKIW